ncbi:MAG: virulence RhuM family protein [Acidobacteria bacterium]|nr:virulence RhuM family protein [Acidobacteriota bacterium]
MSAPESQGEIILYQAKDGEPRVEVRFVDENLWLTQKLIADLYQKDVRTINDHLRNIFEEGELVPDSVIRNFRITAGDGKTYDTMHYSLEAILAVGYRVRSPRGTAFRQWATARLREYLLKGFVLDDERLKNPPGPRVPDYFDEMLERIRDIRSSERRMYLQVRNVFALAADFDPHENDTQLFYQIIQNKLHFAATGKTAPELIAERADNTRPNMGLTSWKGEVVRKTDVILAKNYLNEEEIKELNRIVTMFLDFAEDQARRRKQVFMRSWQEKLDEFLRFNERRVLPGAGAVSREEADKRALGEYEQFDKLRLAQADADAEQDTMRRLAEIAKAVPKRKRIAGGTSTRSKKGKP